ncbi:MAG: hypothetical protein RDV48_18825, partial [Candidatus Eremiobacteraeota bacterium]|nr:hypothetical protein [Candidatus Eremiobacteraeota bacterium]
MDEIKKVDSAKSKEEAPAAKKPELEHMRDTKSAQAPRTGEPDSPKEKSGDLSHFSREVKEQFLAGGAGVSSKAPSTEPPVRVDVNAEPGEKYPDGPGPRVDPLWPQLYVPGPDVKADGPDIKPIGPNLQIKIIGPDIDAIGPHIKAIGPDIKAIGPDIKAIGPDIKAIGPDIKAIGPDIKAIGPDIKAIGPDI